MLAIVVSFVIALVSIGTVSFTTDDDDALYLTPLIEAGRLDDARSMSLVTKTAGMDLESYSGYLTVKPPDKGYMFFWFFPALTNPETAPIILWMNGGPGLTALSGLFAEIGPYYIDDQGKLQKREVHWLTKYNVIFIDTPLGTGFSHVKSDADMSTTSKAIGQDLYSAIIQFFTVFSSYKGNGFYVAGESNGAKYAIALGTEIESHKSTSKINLKGLILISSMYDPINQIVNWDFQYNTGIIDKKYSDNSRNLQTLLKALIGLRLYKLTSEILVGSNDTGSQQPTTNSSFFVETGIVDSDNILYDRMPNIFYTYEAFVNLPDVRRALHVGDVPFRKNPFEVKKALAASGFQTRSLRHELEDLLNVGYRVLAMGGNMDLLVPVRRSLEAADALDWRCSDDYSNSVRIVWKVNPSDDNSAGYIRCGCNYCNAIVRNAGHRLPGDEPVRALDLVDRFINEKPYKD